MTQETLQAPPDERPPLELIALAAWVNVEPDKLPSSMRAPTCEATMTAWKRVADALFAEARRSILSEHDNRVKELEAENARLRELTESAMRPIEAWDDCAHKDDLVLLLVEFEDHSTEDATFALTIGGNNDHNVGEGEGVGWQFAGWSWTHDHWVEGVGKPVGFMPLPHHLARDMEARAALTSTEKEG